MLVRSAGRRQRHSTARILAASFAQLNLPWLAPAQLRWSASQVSSASQDIPRNSRRRCSQSRLTARQNRHLATATDQYAPRYSDQYPLPRYDSPFNDTAQEGEILLDSSKNTKKRVSNLRPYQDPIIINTSIQNPAQTIKVAHGVQGTAVELLQHLHTALQVGRLKRAQAIIQRLSDICSTGSAEMLHAHTAYLEEALRNLALQGRGEEARSMLQGMQKWFEVEVRSKGVFVDAKLLVVMIRASIRALTGSQRVRTVRRYTDMARQLGDDSYYDVLESEDYDDNEFTILGRLTSDLHQDGQDSEPSAVQQLAKSLAPAQYQRNDVLSMDDIPEVMLTEQRGEGLTGIKRALHGLATTPSLPAGAPIDQQRQQALKRQKLLEETCVDVAVDRWRKTDEELRKIGINTAIQSRPIGALMWQWYQALMPALQAELAECRKLMSDPGTVDHDRYHYGPYLELLPLETVAATTILHLMGLITSGKNWHTGKYETEIKVSRLTTTLGKTIEQECKIDVSKQKSSGRKKTGTGSYVGQSLVRHLQAKHGKKKLSNSERERRALVEQLEWPIETTVKLGAILTSKVLETAQLPVTRLHPRTQEKITQLQPAFLHRWKFEKGKKLGMLSPNPALVDKIESEPMGSMIAKRMPMVVEPKPWSSWDEGGYIHYVNPVLRLPVGDKSGKDYFMAAYNKGDMSQVFAGLTALGEVPWKIHHGVFKVQLEAWNTGEEIANFAPLHPKLDLPPEPEASSDPEPRRKWLNEMRDVENKRAGLHSKRCFQNFQLEIARSMTNETLYFPHNMDFRGRAYPIPPYLNHMGADNVRGLLVFAKGKELGPNGLRWLKIHLATVAGNDKASMSERVNFTEGHIDDIYDSVRDPLGGRRWWLQSEDAWQTLAACFELTEALNSANPENFVSHVPIQQDGTCNGLQHYAALGGDTIGAAQVNLEPSDRPADVYTAVAEVVKEHVRQDAALENPIAKKLDGRITRKCVKQPVMTNVYGVTWFGAKEQVQKQLEVLFPEVRKYDDVNLGHMSQYIATKIFRSLGDMFGGAQAIQKWLGQCADRISTCLTPEQIDELITPPKAVEKKRSQGRPSRKAKPITDEVFGSSAGTSESDRKQHKAAKPLFKSTVVWTTPLRLPVVQPYRSMGARKITTSLQQIQLQEPQVWHPVSKRKQLQAFPPNFIHSLDATHMLLSALKCKELGMTFASIHDSFWTHACDVDTLNRVLRDAFVEMHRDNIVGRLHEEFQARYKGCMYLASVLAQSPAGQKIGEWRRHKEKTGPSELAMEAQRMRLLASEDPNERAKGEVMETPSRIMASDGSESFFALPPEISSQQLGNIPARADFEAIATDADERTVPDATSEAEDGGMLEGDVEMTSTGPSSDAAAEKNEQKLRNSAKPKKTYHRKLFVWMPLTFPEVPPKGEFDIRKIRHSDYFFH